MAMEPATNRRLELMTTPITPKTHVLASMGHVLTHLIPTGLLTDLATWGTISLLTITAIATAAIVTKLRRQP